MRFICLCPVKLRSGYVNLFSLMEYIYYVCSNVDGSNTCHFQDEHFRLIMFLLSVMMATDLLEMEDVLSA